MGWGNNRAVSEVLGAILLFGIVILALGSYQTFVVPQQNAAIESNHDAQVSDEFASIQPAVSNAAATGTTRTTSVTLGTRYPVRAAALNPPTVTGQLGTGADGEFAASGFSGSLDEICGLTPETRAITYEANYNELGDTGALTYENGVTYRNAGDGILVQNEQELVDGSTIRLFPLVGEGFSTGSSSSKQLRFVPGETGVRTVDTGSDNLELTLPSKQDESTWEDRLLNEETNLKTVEPASGGVNVVLNSGTYTIECTPIGIGESPSQSAVPTSDTERQANLINPNSTGRIALVKTSTASANPVTITLKNRSNAESTVSIVGGRLNVYSTGGPGNSAGPPADSLNLGGTTLEESGEFKLLSNPIPLNPDETTVDLDFSWDGGGTVKDDHFYVITLSYSNGEIGTYFVSH